MFTYFHQQKFNYDKGQVAPLMILVLVILIIMAMVTVNLYKVAMDKTYSANAVDAGALAAGSVMANVFNAVASSNAEMKKGYELAFYGITANLTIAGVLLALAGSSTVWSQTFAYTAFKISYPSPCGAIPFVKGASAAILAKPAGAISQASMAVSTIDGAIMATTALYAAQLYFYGKLRETAREGRLNAMEQGHRFLFYNSGAGSRLPENIPEGSSWTKSRTDFSRFLDAISAEDNKFVADTYRFDWQDGQGRAHFIESSVTTDDLDAFDLIVTYLPYPGLLALLVAARAAASGAVIALGLAELPLTAFGGAISSLGAACACKHATPVATACWVAASGAAMIAITESIIMGYFAIGEMITAAVALGAAGMGLLANRGNPVRDDNFTAPAILFIICWIDDIIHDRRLRVESTLSQEGADLGLVRTEYPVVHSYSVIDFRGNGKILPGKSEDLSFDASIIETDVVGNR